MLNKNQTVDDRDNRVYTLEDFLSGGSSVDTDVEELDNLAPEPEADPKKEIIPEAAPPVETEIEEEGDEPEAQIELDGQPTPYAELLRSYIEEGDWQDAYVEIDGKQVQLSEIDNLDKDTFLQIKTTQKEIQQEALKEKYIDIDGLNETDLELINLKKSGGDWTYLLKHEAENIHPLEGLDLDSENTQLWLLSEQYKSQGMDAEAIQLQLSSDKKNFRLDEKAKKVVENINTSFSQMVATENKRKQDDLAAIQEQRKELAKNLRGSYKNLELKDTAIQRYVDTATKDIGGGRTKLDALIDSVKGDPDKLAKLTYFLEDEKSFLELNGAKRTNLNNLKTIKLISQTNKKDKDIARTEKQDEKQDPWSKLTFKKQ